MSYTNFIAFCICFKDLVYLLYYNYLEILFIIIFILFICLLIYNELYIFILFLNDSGIFI